MINRGFTLIELVVALVVLAVLISIAIPGFGSMIDQQRMSTGLNNLGLSLSMTRQEAVRMNRTTTLAPISGDWNQGWIIFVDKNNDGAVDAGETILRCACMRTSRWHIMSALTLTARRCCSMAAFRLVLFVFALQKQVPRAENWL